MKVKITTTFFIIFLLITYCAYQIHKDSVDKISYGERILVQLNVINDLDGLTLTLQQLETGARGFVITNDTSFIQPKQDQLSKINIQLIQLKKHSINNPNQTGNVEKLDEYAQNKIAFLLQLIKYAKSHQFQIEKNKIKLTKGRMLMDSVLSYSNKIRENSKNKISDLYLSNETSVFEFNFYFLILFTIISFALFFSYLIIIAEFERNAKIEKEITEANARIFELYDQSPTGYISIDKDGFIIEINKTCLKWLSLSYDEAINKIQLVDLIQGNKINNKLLLTSQFKNKEARINCNRGESLLVLLNSKLNFDSIGELVFAQIALTDISKLKNAETNRNFLSALIENTSDAIISSSPNLDILSWNKGAEKMYGFSELEVLGKNYIDVLKINSTQQDIETLWSNLNNTEKWTIEAIHYHKNGNPIMVSNSISIFKEEEEGNPILISITQDITTRKLYENNLRNFNSELLQKVEEKTKEINEIFVYILEGFISLDKNFNIEFANDYTNKFFGKDPESLKGENIFRILNEPNGQRIKKVIDWKLKKKDFFEMTVKPANLNKWINFKIYLRPKGYSIFFQDISSKKEIELKLIESEKKYRLLFKLNPIPMLILDIENRKPIDVNDAMIANYGYTFEEFLEIDLIKLRPEEDYEKYNNFVLRNKLNKNINYNAGTWTHKKKNGDLIKVEIIVFGLTIDGKEARLILSNDVTEKLRTQRTIEESRDELRMLSSHLENIREEERTSIAREIHDELGQQLTGLKMDASWVSRRLNKNDIVLSQKMDEMIDLINGTVKTIRKIATSLRPGILDDLGLIATLEWQSEDFSKRSGIVCTFSSSLGDMEFDKNVSTTLFRIYQEALTNVARHSKASKVKSYLNIIENKFVELIIEDNGVGFDVKQKDQRTLGLIGMSERTIIMKGDFIIESSKEMGTIIKVKLPLPI